MNTPFTPPTFSLRHLLWSLLASLIFIPLAFWGVSLDEVWRIVQQADWRPVLLAAILFVLTLAAKTARWQLFFQPRLNFVSLFAALSIVSGQKRASILHAETRGEEDEALDGQIMAGLISPL